MKAREVVMRAKMVRGMERRMMKGVERRVREREIIVVDKWSCGRWWWWCEGVSPLALVPRI